jgi:hypothetical protein
MLIFSVMGFKLLVMPATRFDTSLLTEDPVSPQKVAGFLSAEAAMCIA